MYLVHQPTGLAISLGKRMGWGWYVGEKPHPEGPDHVIKNNFFNKCIEELDPGDSQDDFLVVLESDDGWQWVENLPLGLMRFRKVTP